MNRREFVRAGALSLCAAPVIGWRGLEKQKAVKPKWLLEWIAMNDQQLAGYKQLKVTDLRHRYAGGYMDDAEIPNPHSTSAFIGKAGTLIGCTESAFYRSAELLKEIDSAVQALLKMQHSDGTIDLLSTNFHSTPDTAFILENIIPAYRFIKGAGIKDSDNTVQLLKTFLKKAGEALVVGGIHTPNHRWVVSASLTRLNELFPDIRYTNRIDQWLQEHIDIDPDGQYTEKSTNSYSPIVDRSLIVMARGLNKPELLRYVRENLKMNYYYVHPNGEVVTEASNRQDKGTIGSMAKYYYCYRFMALADKDGQMAAMCRLIEKTSSKEQLAGYLDYFLEDPSLWAALPADGSLPVSYAKAFPYSGLVRIRRGNWDATLLSGNTSWLTFHKGNSVLQGMRLATSFFGKGQFQSAKIVQEGDAWVLRQALTGVYYQPHAQEKIDAGGDWNKMPRSGRQQSEIQQLNTIVKVKEVSNGLEITMDIQGTEGVPVAAELIFRAGGTLDGVVRHPSQKNAYLLSAEQGSYSVGKDTIRFGPGNAEHKGVQLRGALPAMDLPTVYLTGFTPFHHVIKLS